MEYVIIGALILLFLILTIQQAKIETRDEEIQRLKIEKELFKSMCIKHNRQDIIEDVVEQIEYEKDIVKKYKL